MGQEIRPLQGYVAGIGRLDTGKHTQQRGLPGAVAPQDAYALPCAELGGDGVEDDPPPAVERVGLRDLVQADHVSSILRRAGRSRSSPSRVSPRIQYMTYATPTSGAE